MNFKEWLEAVMAPSKIGNDIGNINNNDDGGDGDDDDESWNWDNVEKNFGEAIRSWIETSACSKRIKGKILEIVFNTEPKFSEPEMFHEGKEETMLDQGWAEIRVSWEYPVDNIYDRLAATLRNAQQCDFWKALNIQPQEVWNTLDKGELFSLVFHYLNMSISGVFNKNLKTDKTNPNWGTQWMTQYTDLMKDKLTISKYAKFKSRDVQEQAEETTKEYLKDMYKFYNRKEPSDIELDLHEEPRSGGQIYEENYLGTIKYIWTYKVIQ